jgi:acetolactate synthase I/II/III large subunit
MKTLILLGNGAKNDFYNKYNLPIVYSMNGKGIVSDYDPLNLGMIGWKGNDYANKVLNECERLIVVGSRLDVRQISDLSILDYKEVYIVGSDGRYRDMDFKYLDEFYDAFHNKIISKLNIGRINRFNQLEMTINDISLNHKDYTVVTDVGENQLITANAWCVDRKEKFVTTGGLGTMGFAISGAIGVASKGKKTVAICGDGGFQMSIPELETIRHNDFDIKIIVINNHQLKLVADFQGECGIRKISTVEGYSCPDIKLIAKAYDIPYFNDIDEFNLHNKKGILEINV